MAWKCPLCGSLNPETFNNCSCGYSRNGSVLVEEELKEYQLPSEEGEQSSDAPLDCASDPIQALQGQQESLHARAGSGNNPPVSASDEEIIKEIDSWFFTFSRRDNCISIGTPALGSFRLRISVEDLEALLEFLYQKTGREKTTRKINLAVTDIIGVVDKVDRLIEEKKAKVSIKFTSEELQEIAEFINTQLKA